MRSDLGLDAYVEHKYWLQTLGQRASPRMLKLISGPLSIELEVKDIK